jgi:hypothetical protein
VCGDHGIVTDVIFIAVIADGRKHLLSESPRVFEIFLLFLDAHAEVHEVVRLQLLCVGRESAKAGEAVTVGLVAIDAGVVWRGWIHGGDRVRGQGLDEGEVRCCWVRGARRSLSKSVFVAFTCTDAIAHRPSFLGSGERLIVFKWEES